MRSSSSWPVLVSVVAGCLTTNRSAPSEPGHAGAAAVPLVSRSNLARGCPAGMRRSEQTLFVVSAYAAAHAESPQWFPDSDLTVDWKPPAGWTGAAALTCLATLIHERYPTVPWRAEYDESCDGANYACYEVRARVDASHASCARRITQFSREWLGSRSYVIRKMAERPNETFIAFSSTSENAEVFEISYLYAPSAGEYVLNFLHHTDRGEIRDAELVPDMIPLARALLLLASGSC